MSGLSTLGLLGCSAAVVLVSMAVLIRVDPAAIARRRRQERFVRRAAAALVREADAALRETAR